MGCNPEVISAGTVSSRRTRRKTHSFVAIGENTYEDLPPGKPAAVIRYWEFCLNNDHVLVSNVSSRAKVEQDNLKDVVYGGI
jgi:hypothetical protein